MASALTFFLLGLGVGTTYALVALGIVLIYRGSGVVNFAQGGIAFVGAYAYFGLRNAGVPALPGILIGTLGAGALGAAIYLGIMWPLKRSSPLTRTVGTLAALTTIQGIGVLTFGANTSYVGPIFSTHEVHILGAHVGEDRLVLLLIAVVLTAILSLTYRLTTFGLSTSAVAENEIALAALGRSPNLVAALNWGLGGGLAGLAGILAVPIVGLSISQLALLLYPALAAALVGGFSSFWLTCAGGLAVGVIESEITRYTSSPAWPPAVPFLVIVALLVLRGRALPVRSYVGERFPRAGSGQIRWPIVIPLVIAAAVAISLLGANAATAVSQSAGVAIIALSVVIVTGWAGQLSLAQFAMAGMGAFIAAKLAAGDNIPFWIALLIGAAGTVPVGIAIGLPALRTRGVNLAIATLGLGLAIETVIFGNPNYTGGILGLNVSPPHVAGIDLNPVVHPNRYATFALLCFVVLAVLAANMRRGQVGRRLLGVRASERAATAVGINVLEVKLFAFATAAGIAAVGGILLAFLTPSIQFDTFSVDNSVNVILTVVIGGIGFIAGVIPGALSAPGGLFYNLFNSLFNWDSYQSVVTGALAIVTTMTARDGIAGQITTSIHRIVGRRSDPASKSFAPTAPRPAEPVRTTKAHDILELQGLSVRFGGVIALDNVSLRIPPGQITALIGPNGAGKTTLIDAVTGFTSYRGEITLAGRDVRDLSPYRRARFGLGRSFQAVELFDDLTVLDNLRVASDPGRRHVYLTDFVHPSRPALSDEALAAIDECRLGPDLDRLPDELPFGRRRIVGIARAIAARPQVLLLDEPAAGLSADEIRDIDQLIRRLANEWNLAVLLVEHDVELVLGVSDTVAVLDFGRLIAHGTPDEVRSDDAVIAAYLGSEDTARTDSSTGAPR